MASLSCDFLMISKKPCSGDIIELRQCKNDTTGYLKSLNLDIRTKVLEHDLIMSRARTQENVALTINSTVCEHHRYEFGTRWKKTKRTCQYPSHKGKMNISRSISAAMHYELLEMHRKAPAIGEGKLVKINVILIDVMNHSHDILCIIILLKDSLAVT